MENLSERINEKLKLINEDPDTIKPFMIEHLSKIEGYLASVELKYYEAFDTLKLKNISVSAVSKHFNMSRTTLYNHNNLLKRYIEATEALLLSDSPLIQLDRLKAEISNMKAKIEMFYDRDITLEIQKHELHELSNRLKEKNKEIQRLEARNRELSSEILALKRDNRTTTSNVTNLNRSK